MILQVYSFSLSLSIIPSFVKDAQIKCYTNNPYQMTRKPHNTHTNITNNNIAGLMYYFLAGIWTIMQRTAFNLNLINK